MSNQYTKRKISIKSYKQVEDDNGDSKKAWDFLFDKVIQLRIERATRVPLPKSEPPIIIQTGGTAPL